MKKIKRMPRIIATALSLLVAVGIGASIPASAATTVNKYAYSVGVDHGFVWPWSSESSGDFTPNVNYACTAYGMISNVSSYKNYQPTYTYMRGNNANGNRRIASDIVFLNGHGNSDCIAFNHDNNWGDYATGVYIGNDYDSTSGYKYAGFGSTNMNSCDHISLVGCSTASNGNTNITWKAVNKGANSALGFTDSINSRTSDGKGWLQKYNDALANGYTISRCLTYASSFYSSSNLGTYAKIYGSSSNTVASSSKSSSNELTSAETDIPLSRLNNAVDSEITADSKEIELVLGQIKKIDSSFVAEDYKMTINMFAPQDGNGMITFSYYVGENIKTNKAYIAVIENNTVVEIIANNVVTDMLNSKEAVDVNVEAMENAVMQHKKNNDIACKANSVQNITSINSNYYFDFITNELRYEGTIFYENTAVDNVIMDITTTTVLDY